MSQDTNSKINKNGSPPRYEENFNKNSQLFSYEVDKTSDIDFILELMEREGLIDDVMFDRLDVNKADDKDHTHHYFNKNSNVSYNTIDKIVNDYLDKNYINTEIIQREKEKIMNSTELKSFGVLDKEVYGFSGLDTNQLNTLRNAGDDAFRSVGNNRATGDREYLPLRKLSGGRPVVQNMVDNPNEVDGVKRYRSAYNLHFQFDKDLTSISEEMVKESLEEALTQYVDYDLSYLDVQVNIQDGFFEVKFNNLLKHPDENTFQMANVGAIKLFSKQLLTNMIGKNELSIDIPKHIFINEDKMEEEMVKWSSRVQKKAAATAKRTAEYEERKANREDNETFDGDDIQRPKEDTQEPSTTKSTIQDKDLGFYNENKELSVEELNDSVETLEGKLKGMEEFRDIFGEEIMEKKILEVNEKITVLNFLVLEREEEIAAEQELENIKTELQNSKEKIETLGTIVKETQEKSDKQAEDIVSLEETVKLKQEENDSLEEEVVQYVQVAKGFKEDLAKTRKDLELSQSKVSDLEIQKKMDKQAIEDKDKKLTESADLITSKDEEITNLNSTIATKDTEIATLTEEKKTLKAEIDDYVARAKRRVNQLMDFITKNKLKVPAIEEQGQEQGQGGSRGKGPKGPGEK